MALRVGLNGVQSCCISTAATSTALAHCYQLARLVMTRLVGLSAADARLAGQCVCVCVSTDGLTEMNRTVRPGVDHCISCDGALRRPTDVRTLRSPTQLAPLLATARYEAGTTCTLCSGAKSA